MIPTYVPLSQVATLQAGIGFPLEMQGKKNGAYPFAKVGDISRCGRSGNSVLSDADHYVDDEDLAELRGKLIPRGSVLFAKIGEAIRQNHRVISGCDLLIDNNAMAAIPGPNTDCRYLFHFLKTVDFYRLAPATTVPAIRKSDLEKLLTPFPQLPEQRRIAAILDQADALRAKRREALAQLDYLTQSIFIEMFGEPALNALSWPVKTLKEVGKVKTGGTPPSGVDGMFGGSIPFVTPGDLDSTQPPKRTVTEFGAAAAETVRPGAALVCCIGTIGKMDKARLRSAFNQQINAVEWGAAIDDDYGIQALNLLKPQIVAKGSSTTLPILKKSSFEQVTIPVPPILLQKVFSRRVNAIESLKEIHRSALEECDRLFASIQQRAFIGGL